MVFNIKNLDLKIDEKLILDNVNASFKEHQFNAIIGPNGCGKSSLIKVLAKINKKSAGEISFLETDLDKVKREELAKNVAFFFQVHGSYLDITVRQMVAYGRSVHKKMYQSLTCDDNEIIDECIKLCDLEGFEERTLDTLSGGETQRVYLAMTFAQQPKIIVLDEPTNHLDIKYQFQLLSLVRKIMDDNKLTVICILHDFNQVFKYADNTLILVDGKVHSSGETSNVVTTDSVREVFGVESIIHKDGNGHHIDFVV